MQSPKDLAEEDLFEDFFKDLDHPTTALTAEDVLLHPTPENATLLVGEVLDRWNALVRKSNLPVHSNWKLPAIRDNHPVYTKNRGLQGYVNTKGYVQLHKIRGSNAVDDFHTEVLHHASGLYDLQARGRALGGETLLPIQVAWSSEPDGTQLVPYEWVARSQVVLADKLDTYWLDIQRSVAGIAAESQVLESKKAKVIYNLAAKANTFLVIDRPATVVEGQRVLCLLEDDPDWKHLVAPSGDRASDQLRTNVTKVVACPDWHASETGLFFCEEYDCHATVGTAVVVYNDHLLGPSDSDATKEYATAHSMLLERIDSTEHSYPFNETVWNPAIKAFENLTMCERLATDAKAQMRASLRPGTGLADRQQAEIAHEAAAADLADAKQASKRWTHCAFRRFKATNRRLMADAGYKLTSEQLGGRPGGLARLLAENEPAQKEHEALILEPAFDQYCIQTKPRRGQECLAEALAAYQSHPSGSWADYEIKRPSYESLGLSRFMVAHKLARVTNATKDTLTKAREWNFTHPLPPDPLSPVPFVRSRLASACLPCTSKVLPDYILDSWPAVDKYVLHSNDSHLSAMARLCKILVCYDDATFHMAISIIIDRYNADTISHRLVQNTLTALPYYKSAASKLRAEESGSLVAFASSVSDDVFGLLASFLPLGSVVRLCSTCRLFSECKILTDRRPTFLCAPSRDWQLAWSKCDEYTKRTTFRAGVQIGFCLQFGAKATNAWLRDPSDASVRQPLRLRDSFSNVHCLLIVKPTLVFDSINREVVPTTSHGAPLLVPPRCPNFDRELGALRFDIRETTDRGLDVVVKLQALSYNYHGQCNRQLAEARASLPSITDVMKQREVKKTIDELEERNAAYQHFRVRVDISGTSQNGKAVTLMAFSDPFVTMSKKRKQK